MSVAVVIDSVNSIYGILRNYALEVGMRMRSQLDSVLMGSIVRTQLPQVWNFVTEQEEAHFSVDREGNCEPSKGKAGNPDVTVAWKHDYLMSVLATRTLEGIPPGEEPKITTHTIKGKIGYAMMRKYLRFP